jgi:hypothetical protein
MEERSSFSKLTVKEKIVAAVAVLLILALTATVCYQTIIISKTQKIINSLDKTVSSSDNDNKVVWLNPDDNTSQPDTLIAAENDFTDSPSKTETETKAEEPDRNGKIEYVLNTSSKRIHSPDCPSVEETKDKNKRTVVWDEAEFEKALDDGYKPCGRCNAGR